MLRQLTLLAVVVCALAAVGWAEEPRPPLKLLFLGDAGHHQPAVRFRILQPVLAARGITLDYTETAADLNAEKLAGYAGLALYANIDELGDAETRALLDFVAGGKGFVPLHCASFCFRNQPELVSLIGAQFLRHGTGVFRVEPTEAARTHPLMQGYGGFESWDETYVHAQHNEQDRVVLEVRREGATTEPWTWVRTHGRGRVFYTAWGHDERTWGHAGFQNLVERGIRWACGDDPGRVQPYADRPAMAARPADLRPFEYVPADVPYYPAGKPWGTTEAGERQMQMPLSPAESLKRLVVPQGFQVELFVSEPELAGKPIAMNWDEHGRLWVCETVDYPNDLQPEGAGRDRIRICTDTDGDGRADRFTVFAEQLSIPTAIAFYRGGAIVQNGTETLYLRDQDGDDRADLRKVLVRGWSLGDTHGGVSNFQYGLDNWYYAMQGYNASQPVLTDGRKVTGFRMGFFRFRVEGAGEQTTVTDLEFLRSTNNNTWGLGLSEEGLVFGSTANGNPSEFMPIANRYYERVRGWSAGVLEGIADSNQFEALPSAQLRQVDHHGGFTAAAGHALYTARRYPQEYWNRAAFVTEATGHLVATFLLRPEGGGFRSRNAWNLLASDDEWTAPIVAEVGPDGNVWCIDWYNFIVQHNPTPAGYQTGKGNAYESPLRDKTHGRIYRVVYGERGKEAEGARFDAPWGASGGVASRELAAAWVQGLANDNLFWRRQAQRLLVERGMQDVLPTLCALAARDEVDAIGLNSAAIHALQTLAGLEALSGANADADSVEVARRALGHRSAGVRRTALTVLARNEQLASEIQSRQLTADADPQVRLAAYLALAEAPPSPGLAQHMAERWQSPDINDRWLRDGLICAAARQKTEFLRSWLASTPSPAEPPPLEAVAIVSRHAAREATADDIGLLVETMGHAAERTEAHAAVVAVLRGLVEGASPDDPITFTAEGEQAFVRLFESLPSSSRGMLVELGRRWQVRALEAQAALAVRDWLTTVSNGELTDAERLAAAEQVSSFGGAGEEAVAAIVELLNPRESPVLVVGLIDALGKGTAPATGRLLVDRLAVLSPESRQVVLRVLLSRADWTKALLKGAQLGKLSLSELSLDQRQALAAHPNRILAETAKALLARGSGLPAADRQQVLDELLPTLLATGDAAAGKEVFKKTCAKCHTHSGEGARIGPDLTGMAVHSKQELAIHLLDPSRSVEGNFRMYTVATRDGRVWNGLLAAESQTTIELVDTEGKRQALPREEIEELVATPKSLMPEGFEKQHSPEELRNLLEFLTQRGAYLPLPLDHVATAVSTQGMFNSESAEVERLILNEWSPKTIHGVPFVLVDPQGNHVRNVVLLRGSQGSIPPRMPGEVSLPCRSAARAIHLLSGVSGWGWPASPAGTVTLIVRLHYADGATEDHALKNGEHFADYIRRVDVPGSEFAFAAREQQVRYLRIQPGRDAAIDRIDLVKGDDVTAPVVLAVTVETR